MNATDIERADAIRREMLNTNQAADDLAANTGQTWNTTTLQEDFDVQGFAAPLVVVRRRSDGQLGTLEFTHSPRVYFNWEPHT